MGLPVFLFTPLRISRRYAVSANKTGAQRPSLLTEMELARQEMNYFYNSWLDLKGSIWKRDLCDRPLSTQAKTNIITILLIRNTLPEVDRLIKMLYWLIYIFNKILKVKTGPLTTSENGRLGCYLKLHPPPGLVWKIKGWSGAGFVIVQDFFFKRCCRRWDCGRKWCPQVFCRSCPAESARDCTKRFLFKYVHGHGLNLVLPLSQFRSKVNVIFFSDWFLRKNTPIPSVIISYI